ncbi:hypothetical protein ACFYOK_04590 [Microbispora bryophytorum]|uniref:hypothetical protein n=1 Tax=Microbispora bryophytorum TaxID=1460882 RepID=UPI0034059D58
MDGATLADALIKWGPAGLFVLLFVIGWIHAKPAMDSKEAEIAWLRQALADERAAREAERKTYHLETASANAAALEAAKTTAHLLTDLRERNAEARP